MKIRRQWYIWCFSKSHTKTSETWE